MGKMTPATEPSPGGEKRPVPQWTFWEVLGLIVSVLLVAAPLLALGYSFAFPPQAPAADELWPTIGPPTPTGSPTAIPPTYPTNTPSDTPTNTPIITITDTPIVPTDTPTPEPPTNTPTNTPGGCSDITVDKAADRNVAYPGETVVFSIGLTNRTGSPVTISLSDALPAEMSYSDGWNSCAAGSGITPGSGGFSASMVVPAGQTCQIVVSAVVNSGCNCYVQNRVTSWNGGGCSGSTSSQQILLPIATAVVPTTIATDTPIPGVTDTPTNTPPPVATNTPTYTPPPGVTNTPTYTPPPGATNTPTYTPPPVVTVPSTPATTPGVVPTAAPTERPPRTRREATEGPTPICAQARISGKVCAAGAVVTISSCCPRWSAQTTSNTSGAFEFNSLTPGTFTVSARGLSRTVKLEKCDSAVTVNLCPTTPKPTVPATAMTPASPTLTATVAVSTTRPPTANTLLLEAVGAADNFYQPGEGVPLQLTLHNGQRETLRGVMIGMTFDPALDVLGAASRGGEIRTTGQDFLLTGANLAPGKDLVVHLDVAVRINTPNGTIINLQATARTSAGAIIDSNVLQIEIWGEGMQPPPAGGTPLGAVTPVGGGPEPQPTHAPAPPGTQTPTLPPTSTGMPIVGIMIGGGVLLARQLRLRRAARQQEK